jgi:glycosyltransferase involved in cell wall biosynthesis
MPSTSTQAQSFGGSRTSSALLEDVSIVVPAHNAAGEIDRCLSALDHAQVREVIVVDDGSTDGTGAIAARHRARVETLPARSGAALARNHGVRLAGGNVVLFVDADIVAEAEVVERAVLSFAELSTYAALFGSYDAEPGSSALVAKFRNLLHHYTHQIGRREADTFWSGFGLVRRDAFQSVGGFDPVWTGLEDIELGYRMRARGHHIRLDPSLQVKHLKQWNLRSMLNTDFQFRARLWTLLILARGELPDDLNVRRAQRASVFLAGLIAASLVASFADSRWLGVLAIAVAGLCWLNRGFYALLREKGGIPFALCCFPLHVVYFLSAGLGFVSMWLEHRLGLPGAQRVSA